MRLTKMRKFKLIILSLCLLIVSTFAFEIQLDEQMNLYTHDSPIDSAKTHQPELNIKSPS